MVCDDPEKWDGAKVGGKLEVGGYRYALPDFMLLYKQKLTKLLSNYTPIFLR